MKNEATRTLLKAIAVTLVLLTGVGILFSFVSRAPESERVVYRTVEDVSLTLDIIPTDRNSLFQGLLIGASVLLGLRGCKSDPDHLKGFRDILVTERSHEYANAWWPPGHIIGYEHSFVHAAVDFMQAVKDGTGIKPDFNDGVKIIEVLEAALRSMEGAGRVDL